MAPVPPSKRRSSGTANAARSGRGAISSSKNSNLFDDDFRTSKKDKRVIKHSTFMSKIEKSHKKTPKRRRPSKKLVANLDSLADALPTEPDAVHEDSQVNVIKHKTLRNRPGAMKRKEKLEQLERDRFMKNMAQMNTVTTTAVPAANQSTTTPASDEQTTTSGRWAALRSFITQTMDQQPAFKDK